MFVFTRYTYAVILAVTLGFAGVPMSVHAQTERSAAIIAAASAPVVDGRVDAVWAAATPIPVTNVFQTVTNAADLTASFRLMYTAERLYLLVEVTDDVLQESAFVPWLSDGVEIYVDGDYSNGGFYDGINDYQIIAPLEGGLNPGFATAIPLPASAVARFERGTGSYVFEYSMLWRDIGVTTVQPGARIGFDIMVNDNDDGFSRSGKLMWNSTTDFGYFQPSDFGNAVTGPPAALTPTATPVVPTATATQPLPTATAVLPTATATQPPPTATAVLPTATATRPPSTATPVVPTATATRPPSTATPMVPTATATQPPPTATPVVPTATATRTPAFTPAAQPRTPTATATATRSAVNTPTATAVPPRGNMIRRVTLPLIRAPFNNHTRCTALPITPPVTVSQASNQVFNMYAFQAVKPTYNVQIQGYTYPGNDEGQVLIYRVVSDACASGGTRVIELVSNARLFRNSLFDGDFVNTFTPGTSYLLIIYTRGGISAAEYQLTVR
jgi:Carbohydrate family 9 binding domain-like